jgi:predicted transcriptional regulator
MAGAPDDDLSAEESSRHPGSLDLLETLVQEAVDRLLNYNDCFLREVDKGLAAADRGEFVEHDDIRKTIDSRYPA